MDILNFLGLFKKVFINITYFPINQKLNQQPETSNQQLEFITTLYLQYQGSLNGCRPGLTT